MLYLCMYLQECSEHLYFGGRVAGMGPVTQQLHLTVERLFLEVFVM